MASAITEQEQQNGVGAASKTSPSVPAPSTPSLLPSLSSVLSPRNWLELAFLLFQPVAFFVTLPFFLWVGFMRFYLLGGRGQAQVLASTLPALTQARLEKMTEEAALPRPASAPVSTSTRTAHKSEVRGFQSQFVQNGDVSLHVVVGGDFGSSKPILLFVHGFPENWSTWQAQLVYFARLGFPVAAMDLRGFGQSSAPSSTSSYRARPLVSDVTKVIHALRASSHQRSEVILVAHDIGGVLAWNVAFTKGSDDAKAVSKFVILNAPHPAGFVPYALYSDRFQLVRSWYIAYFQLPWLPEFVMLSAPYRMARLFSSCDRDMTLAQASNPAIVRGMLSYYRASMRSALYGAAALESEGEVARKVAPVPVARPVLQLWGKNDTVLAKGLVTDLPKKWTTHPQSRVKLLEATHWVMHDQPREVNEAILKFVQEE